MSAAPLPVKKDPRTRIGAELVRREAAIWEARGWTVEKAWRQYIRLRDGRAFPGPRDFFHRHDFMAARPAVGALALVQVSAEPESGGKHKPPLGFAPGAGPVEALIDLPIPGVFEVYVYYRKFKGSVRWRADRRWWTA